MPESAKTVNEFNPNSEFRDTSIRVQLNDDHAKSAADLNNGNGFSPLCYEDNDFYHNDLLFENSLVAKHKREVEHR